MRVLVVEDEVKLASLIRRGLREEGLLADVAIKGEDALWMAQASPYDVIVLDVMLPGLDGFETCRRLRDGSVRSPILMLGADRGGDRARRVRIGRRRGAGRGAAGVRPNRVQARRRGRTARRGTRREALEQALLAQLVQGRG